jgi:hypothetical protein
LTNRPFDIGLGYGQPGIEGSGAADILFGRRWSTTLLASYTRQLGSNVVHRVPNAANAFFPLTAAVPGTYSAGDVLSVAVIPRYEIARFFTIDGTYVLRRTGGDQYTPIGSIDCSTACTLPATLTGPPGATAATVQQLGIGFSYSTVRDAAPGRLPAEMRFQHVETITGTGGPVAKTFRDQIELRVFYQRRTRVQ